MAKITFLIKVENGEETFVSIEEYGTVYDSRVPKMISNNDLAYAMSELTKTEPRAMCGPGGDNLSLPSNVHRLSGISYEKPEAKFDLKIVQVDFVDNTMETIAVYHYDVKQWPEGHVRIS